MKSNTTIMKDLKPWDEYSAYQYEFDKDENGQFTIFQEISEPPDPDDFENLEDFDQAYLAWDFRQSTLTGDQLSDSQELDQSSITGNSQQQDDDVIELPHGCLNTYLKKGNWYYRYSYRDGKKLKHIHLCPVRVKSDKHQELLDAVKQSIARKAPFDAIIRNIDYLKN